jgi:hypothetical protein
MAEGAIIRGLEELDRDFRKIAKDVTKEFRKELIEAAEPVKRTAEELALGRIRNMPRSPRWAGMRIGVSVAKSSIYMVPSARRRGSAGRPNLANLLLERAMDPAVEQSADQIVGRVDAMVAHLAARNGF